MKKKKKKIKEEVEIWYITEMSDTTDHYAPWIYISSKLPTNVIQDMKANTTDPSDVLPMPFLNSSINEVYKFFKDHLRPADDDPRGIYHTFTYFTFLVVDAECLESEPWQCILCTDAPDYGEAHSEILKQFRLPIARAMQGLLLLETLVNTPSEYVNSNAWNLGMVPAAWDVEILNERGERTGCRKSATPGRARRKKRQAIEEVEETARQQQAEAESADPEGDILDML